MHPTRLLRAEERTLIAFILQTSGLNLDDYPINNNVYEYEGGIMGSISFSTDDNHQYDSDILQLEYIDADNTSVVITLTKDANNQLLDLDFWKVDFSKLLTYPTPDKVVIKRFQSSSE